MTRRILLLQLVFFIVMLLSVTIAIAKQPEPIEKLGKAIYNNKNLSIQRPQACMSCHHPKAGFADPKNTQSPYMNPVSEGSIPKRFGNRNAPTAAYSGFSPIFHFQCEEYDPPGSFDPNDCVDGLFIGGTFWDGRASGRDVTATGDLGAGPTYDPIADQAKGPFLNPIEMGLGSIQEVVDIVLASDAGGLFMKLNPDAFDVDGNVDYDLAYNRIAEAIAAFERSFQVNKFNSRFDKFVAEQIAKDPSFDPSLFGISPQSDGFRFFAGPLEGFKSNHMSQDELIGLSLFNSDSDNSGSSGRVGGMCYACHPTADHVVEPDDPNRVVVAGTYPAMYTDFSYDNLGVPVNERAVQLFEIFAGVGNYTADLGLGAQVPLMEDACIGWPCNAIIGDLGSAQAGTFKVSGLRDIAETAPYSHNGYFPTLHSIVHFYNTAGVKTECTGNLSATDAIAANCWPAPEVGDANRDELGNLGLNSTQEMQIVMFMQTLSDGK